MMHKKKEDFTPWMAKQNQNRIKMKEQGEEQQKSLHL
jgi:hypothetical protein